MTTHEEAHRKDLLHTQAAELLMADALRHVSEAKRLREETARLEESGK
ncbi:MAG: hypothetical protein WC405_07110 [Syntrophales bacterium]